MTIGIVGFSFGWMFRLGSDWQLAVMQPNSWGVGVNLFAATIVFALIVHSLSDENESPAPKPPIADAPSHYDY